MPAGLLPAVSLPPSLLSHAPAATPEPGLFIETLSSKKVFPIAPRRGMFSATQSPSNCEDATYQLHKINLFS